MLSLSFILSFPFLFSLSLSLSHLGQNELKKVKASEDDTHIIKEDLQSMQSTAIAFSRSLVEAKLQEIEEA